MQIRIGTSGWSYPSWRPGFYPAGSSSADFLRLYAERFDTVELNTTGYRLPAVDQFQRWADSVPDGFCFAPKLALGRLDRLEQALVRFSALGDRLGPVRVVVPHSRDERLLAAVVAAAPPSVELAFDFRHPSWAGVEGLVAVGDPAAAPFRYIRLREPPYSEAELLRLAEGLQPPAYVYFRHEEQPSAPAYAARLKELLSGETPRPGSAAQ